MPLYFDGNINFVGYIEKQSLLIVIISISRTHD